MKISRQTPYYADLSMRILAFAIDYLFIAAYLLALTVLGLFIRRDFPDFLSTLFGDPSSGEIAGFFALTLPVTLYFSLLEFRYGMQQWGKDGIG